MTNATTKAVVVTAPGQVEVREFPSRALQAHEVRVANTYSAVSLGTEYLVLSGKLHDATFPCLLGYQAVGRVTEVGPEVTAYKVGDRVLSGCSPFHPPGFGYGAGNAHQSHPIVADKGDWAQKALVQIPDGVSDEEAGYAWLMSVSMQGVERSRVSMKDTVAVVGLGMVGQFAAQAARASGAKVYACDLAHERAELARQFSADVVVEGDVAALDAKIRAEHKGGASVVIECTGNTKVLDAALDLAEQEGRVVLQGHYPGQLAFRFIVSHSKRLTLFCPCAWGDLRPVMDLMQRGKLTAKPWVQNIFSSNQVPELYKRVHDRDPSLASALIKWN